MRSAECWTDHNLLRAKIQLMVPHKPAAMKTRARYAVSTLRDAEVRDAYRKSMKEEVVTGWNPSANGEGKWAVLDWCATRAIVPSGGDRTLPGTNVKQLVHVDVLNIYHGPRNSVCRFVPEDHHLLGGFFSRFKVHMCVCVCVCMCV